MSRSLMVMCALALGVVIAGCGGGGEMATAPPDGPGPVQPNEQVGPFVIQTAASANFQMQTIPNPSGAAFVALHGAELEYVAAQEMLDRIVYHISYSVMGSYGLGVCDLFGDNATGITSQSDWDPHWSPAGDQIVCSSGSGTGSEIVLMNADGSGREELTDNSYEDYDPAFSPDGLLIAFESIHGADSEIYTMFLTGNHQTNITADDDEDYDPSWTGDREILHSDTVVGDQEIARMADDGTGETSVTDPVGEDDRHPTWSPQGLIAFAREDSSGNSDIYIAEEDGSHEREFVATDADEIDPCFSTDGRFLAYARWMGMSTLSAEDEVDTNLIMGGWSIYVKEMTPPYREYLARSGVSDYHSPDLGSPTLQISRVLIGPDYSDRGYNPPIQPAVAYGAIAAFNDEGYLNFIRIGVNSWKADTLGITARENVGDELVAVELTADSLNALHQDNGAGEDAQMWDLAGTTTTAALLLLNPDTGNIASVLVLDDVALSSASADSEAMDTTFRQEGGLTIVEGGFKALFDGTGALIAQGDIGSVEVDIANGTARVL